MTKYAEFLATHDECDECGNAACRGIELFPMRIDGKVEARCWDCLLLRETYHPAPVVVDAGQLANDAATKIAEFDNKNNGSWYCTHEQANIARIIRETLNASERGGL